MSRKVAAVGEAAKTAGEMVESVANKVEKTVSNLKKKSSRIFFFFLEKKE